MPIIWIPTYICNGVYGAKTLKAGYRLWCGKVWLWCSGIQNSYWHLKFAELKYRKCCDRAAFQDRSTGRFILPLRFRQPVVDRVCCASLSSIGTSVLELWHRALSLNHFARSSSEANNFTTYSFFRLKWGIFRLDLICRIHYWGNFFWKFCHIICMGFAWPSLEPS